MHNGFCEVLELIHAIDGRTVSIDTLVIENHYIESQHSLSIIGPDALCHTNLFTVRRYMLKTIGVLRGVRDPNAAVMQALTTSTPHLT